MPASWVPCQELSCRSQLSNVAGAAALVGRAHPVTGVARIGVTAVAVVRVLDGRDEVVARQHAAGKVGMRGDAGVEHCDDGARASPFACPRSGKTRHATQPRSQRVRVAAAGVAQPPLAVVVRVVGLRLQEPLAFVGDDPFDIGVGAQLCRDACRVVAVEHASEVEMLGRAAHRARPELRETGVAQHVLQAHRVAAVECPTGAERLGAVVGKRLGALARGGILELDDQTVGGAALAGHRRRPRDCSGATQCGSQKGAQQEAPRLRSTSLHRQTSIATAHPSTPARACLQTMMPCGARRQRFNRPGFSVQFGPAPSAGRRSPMRAAPQATPDQASRRRPHPRTTSPTRRRRRR